MALAKPVLFFAVFVGSGLGAQLCRILCKYVPVAESKVVDRKVQFYVSGLVLDSSWEALSGFSQISCKSKRPLKRAKHWYANCPCPKPFSESALPIACSKGYQHEFCCGVAVFASKLFLVISACPVLAWI